jgi:pyridoxal 5'-phosphate synthase pdxT subunit
VIKVGVLELQGDFELHHKILYDLGICSVGVKFPKHLNCLDGLIIPGGESTTMSLLIDSFNLRNSILDFSEKKPVLGTCAGLILMSKKIENDVKVNPLGILDVVVDRNAYGRQIMSEKKHIEIHPNPHVFVNIKATLIRAPKITSMGKNVISMGKINSTPVAVFDGKHIGLSFHPELDGISIFHEMLFDSSSKLFSNKFENFNAA